MKVCFTSSSGGHFAQLMKLKPLMKENDSFIVTEKTKSEEQFNYPVYYLKQVNRKEWKCPFYIFYNTIQSIHILEKEKPDFIISTGVLATIPICVVGKLSGAKLIYIESFAKVHSKTLTGKLLYHFADYFFVQWETMKEQYPNAIFKGGLY